MKTIAASDAVSRLLQSLRLSEQPTAFYSVRKDVLKHTTGYIFVTLFVIHRGETLRIFTTEDVLYPVGVRKPMRSTPWGDLVIQRQKAVSCYRYLRRSFGIFRSRDHRKIGLRIGHQRSSHL